jgi:hypothetical protein
MQVIRDAALVSGDPNPVERPSLNEACRWLHLKSFKLFVLREVRLCGAALKHTPIPNAEKLSSFPSPPFILKVS